jgi:hypothetical protein
LREEGKRKLKNPGKIRKPLDGDLVRWNHKVTKGDERGRGAVPKKKGCYEKHCPKSRKIKRGPKCSVLNR